MSVDAKSLWVMKSNEHRGIKVQQFSQLDLHAEGSFVQQFIRHPLLISDRYCVVMVTVVHNNLLL